MLATISQGSIRYFLLLNSFNSSFFFPSSSQETLRFDLILDAVPESTAPFPFIVFDNLPLQRRRPAVLSFTKGDYTLELVSNFFCVPEKRFPRNVQHAVTRELL